MAKPSSCWHVPLHWGLVITQNAQWMRIKQEELSSGEPTSLSSYSEAVADIMLKANDLRDGDDIHTHSHTGFEVLSDGYISMKCLIQHEWDYSYTGSLTLEWMCVWVLWCRVIIHHIKTAKTRNYYLLIIKLLLLYYNNMNYYFYIIYIHLQLNLQICIFIYLNEPK